VVNIGVRPTVDANDLTVETHLLDFGRDLYGEVLRLHFVARLRDEEKFPHLDALVTQMKRDIAQARQILIKR